MQTVAFGEKKMIMFMNACLLLNLILLSYTKPNPAILLA